MPIKSVARYRVYISAGFKNFNVWRYNVRLWDESGKKIATLRFRDDFAENIVNVEGCSTLNLPVEAYQNTIDLLRNEKPVYLILYPAIEKVLLSTSKEPIGEEES